MASTATSDAAAAMARAVAQHDPFQRSENVSLAQSADNEAFLERIAPTVRARTTTRYFGVAS